MLVNNIEQLRNAVNNNETEIILAESGDFVDESVKINGREQVVFIKGKDEITIRSENPDNPQTLVGLDIRESEDIQIENVKLTAYDKDYAKAGLVTNSNNVVFSDVIFQGRDDFESVNVFGLSVRNSDNVTIENSLFSNFRKGLGSLDSSNFTAVGNEFVDMAEDAIDIANSKSVTIENNIIRDYEPDVTKRKGAHPDAIQLSARDGKNLEQISIKNNVILIGDSLGFQGIFVKRFGDSSAKDFEIENNLIHTNFGNGIYFGDDGKSTNSYKNIAIKNNTLVFRDSQATESNTTKTGILLSEVENAAVENNIAGFFSINNERFGGGTSFKEPIDGNIATNFKSFGSDLPYEEVFVNGDKLTDPEFYSTVSPEKFAVLDGIDAGANLEQLRDATAGDSIGASLGGNEGTVSPEPTILISFNNANNNGDVLGTAQADVMQAEADNSSGNRLRALGRDGNDTLTGASNVDISGENGDDKLILNGGNSFVWGGSGSDTFVITSETKSGSTILDFQKGVDTIVFEEIEGVSSMSDLSITPQNPNFTANSFINFGDEQIKIKGMMTEDFSPEDFQFS